MFKQVYIDGVELLTARGPSLKDHRSVWDRCVFQNYKKGWGAQVKDFSFYNETKKLDRATQFAVHTAYNAFENCRINIDKKKTGVVMGSSRGATETLELQHQRHLQGESVSVFSSPLTTQGIFASAVARYLELGGSQLSVSSACATGLQALIVGASWIHCG